MIICSAYVCLCVTRYRCCRVHQLDTELLSVWRPQGRYGPGERPCYVDDLRHLVLLRSSPAIDCNTHSSLPSNCFPNSHQNYRLTANSTPAAHSTRPRSKTALLQDGPFLRRPRETKLSGRMVACRTSALPQV